MRFFGLDAGARDEVKKVWPIIMPRVEQALDLMLQAATHQPNISQTIKEHRSALEDLPEISHLKVLTSGDLGPNYFASCREYS